MAEKEHGILTTIQWLGIYILKECVFVCMYVCHLFVGAYIHKDPTSLRRLIVRRSITNEQINRQKDT